MSAGKANCAICGKPLVYFAEGREVQCAICGKTEVGHSICEDGHYVCDACHRANGVAYAIELCSSSTSKNPVEIFVEAAHNKSIYPNGPEHHTLVGASLLCAYANAGGDIDLDRALEELKKRSLQVPGGTCGFWGCCGAATSAGQAMSIINGSTPMKRVEWSQCQRLTSNILGKLADLGGPRCCKRTGFTALLESIDYIAQVTGVQMEKPETVMCQFCGGNPQCLKMECPYYPGRVKEAEKVVSAL